MPRWKSARENFSLGPCRLSSFWPQPRRSVSTFRCCLIRPDDRDRAPFADEDGLGAEADLDGPDGGPDAGGVDVDQHRRGPVVGHDLDGHPGGRDLPDVLAEEGLDGLGVLVGDEAEAELRPGLAGQDRLGPGPGVAAEEAVDVAGRPGPLPFEGGVAVLADQARSRPGRPGTRPPRTAAWRTRPAPSPPAA